MWPTVVRTIERGWVAALICLAIYFIIWLIFRSLHREGEFYFDPQDFHHYENGGGRELPLSAKTTTFEPMLKHYMTLAQLIITIAAASIAFGGTQNPKPSIAAAKVFLAFCILYGVLFCSTVLYRYDEYNQNVRSYTRFWYSTVESLGFAALACFVLGYLAWALAAFR